MKQIAFLCICIVVAALSLTSAVVADIGVGVVDIKPSGDLEAGVTDVVADFTIEFYSIGGLTIATTENVRLSTDLTNPSWSCTVIRDGIEEKRFVKAIKSGDYSIAQLDGWDLSYSSTDMRVKVQLTGRAPQTSSSQEILVAGVDLVDNTGRSLNEAKRAMKFVLNPNELKGEVSETSSKLTKLRSAIDKTAGTGADVRSANAKYDEASTAISRANSATYVDAQVYLQNAETFIDEAYSLLDKGVVESGLVELQATIDSVDEWITYFQDHGYTTDPRLAPIVTKREFASEDYIDAKLAFDKKDYATAKEKTEVAQTRANDALEASQKLNDEIEKGAVATVAATQTPGGDGNTTPPDGLTKGLFGSTIVRAVIAIVVLGVIIAFLYMRFGGSGGNRGGKKRNGGGRPRSSKSSKSQYDELF